jgi:ABC-type amino acid transport substrate-binding protein
MGSRLWTFAALALVLVVALPGCGDSDDESSADTADAKVKAPESLVAPGKLTIAADFQGPPFDYLEGSDKKGFDVEFDKAAAELMGLEPNYVDTRFAALVSGLEAGRFDAVISVLYITKERVESIDMVPYAQTGSGFLVKDDGDFQPKTPEDLCGHTVAALAGGFEEQVSTEGQLAKACKEAGEPIEVKSFPTDVEATRDLSAGRSDAFFTNHSIVLYRAEQFPELNLSVSNSKPLFPVPAGIGVRKDRLDVRKALEQAVAHMRKTGELQRLLEKYGLEEPDPELVRRALAGNLY